MVGVGDIWTVVQGVVCPVTVVVHVSVVSEAVVVGVHGFRGVVREGIVGVQDTVVVVIGIHGVADAVHVKVGWDVVTVQRVGIAHGFVGVVVTVHVGVLARLVALGSHGGEGETVFAKHHHG